MSADTEQVQRRISHKGTESTKEDTTTGTHQFPLRDFLCALCAFVADPPLTFYRFLASGRQLFFGPSQRQDRQRRAAEEAQGEADDAQAARDVEAGVAFMEEAGGVASAEARRDNGRADKGQADLPAVRVAGENQVHARR